MNVDIRQGDCLEVLRTLPDASVDAVVTDPPYGLEFMGKDWDAPWRTGDGFRRSRNAVDVARADPFGRASRTSPEYRAGVGFQFWCEEWAHEVLRVLKPGGHLLAFGGTRTYHRLACGTEDAGFEVRDSLQWIYGSGFPKSLDVSKVIDKGVGYWRGRAGDVSSSNAAMSGPNYERTEKGEPVTAAASAWRGWGTALKPSHEPVLLARKPLAEPTVASQVLVTGTGALNIDGCRVAHTPGDEGVWGVRQHASPGSDGLTMGGGWARSVSRRHDSGRWPANLVLSHAECGEECVEGCPVAELDRQSGDSQSRVGQPRSGANGDGWGMTATGAEYGDHGGASRFFYTAKADGAERNAGLEGLRSSAVHRFGAGIGEGHDPKAPAYDRNIHPTVKPVDLMRWLCRLVTPPGGTILDPFMGSGSTGVAAKLEGFSFIGIEREAEYVEIAKRRLDWAVHEPTLFDLDGG